jgi:hypothetical protein
MPLTLTRYTSPKEVMALRELWRDEEWAREEILLSLLDVIEIIDTQHAIERRRTDALARRILGLPTDPEMAAQVLKEWGIEIE